MKLLPLHGGGVAGIDDEDFAHVSRHTWTLHRPSPSRTRATRYAVARINGRNVYLHLFLWRLWGRDPVPVVDHHDTDGLHCTRLNLRDASVAQNNRNRGKLRTNTSGYKGVNWDKRKGQWRAKIQVDGTRLHLGYFEDPVHAARAYDQAAQEHHKEFAVLNLKGETDAIISPSIRPRDSAATSPASTPLEPDRHTASASKRVRRLAPRVAA